mmetsp:Transcript_106262/g.188947  ORF Transcript_106262/g.188947 Transcript_106262/m.188947 type:complete len:128 (+) Transcript_106262:63-446(+)
MVPSRRRWFLLLTASFLSWQLQNYSADAAAFMAGRPWRNRLPGALRAAHLVGDREGITEEQWAEVLRLPDQSKRRSRVLGLSDRIALRLPERHQNDDRKKRAVSPMYCLLFMTQLLALVAVVDWTKF